MFRIEERGTESTDLSEEPCRNQTFALVKPVDDRVCVFLDTCREDDDGVPCGNLRTSSIKCGLGFGDEFRKITFFKKKSTHGRLYT